MCYLTSPSISKGNKDQRELELGEGMSNEAVDINAEEYKKVNATSPIRVSAANNDFSRLFTRSNSNHCPALSPRHSLRL